MLGGVLAGVWWWVDDARVLVPVETYAAPQGQVYKGESGYKVALDRIDNHLGSTQGYEVWLGRAVDTDQPYGHVIEVPQGWETDGLRVDWRPDGVNLLFADGGRIFVPADRFTGGR